MADYGKMIKDKLAQVGTKVSTAASDAVDKAKKAAESATKSVTGNDGGLGKAKGAIRSREQQLNEAVDEQTKMANGGKVKGRKKK